MFPEGNATTRCWLVSAEGERVSEETKAPSRSYSFLVTDAQLAILAAVIVVERALSLASGSHVQATHVIVIVAFDAALFVFLILGFRVAWWLMLINFGISAVIAAYVATRGHAIIGAAGLLLNVIGIVTLWRIWVPRLWTIV
jgi:membrane-bound ClpP family serine protease